MDEIIVVYLPYILSVVTIWTMWMAGNKSPVAWIVGLLNQILWVIWILATHSYGLLPMTGAICFVYARNYLRWSNAEGTAGAPTSK